MESQTLVVRESQAARLLGVSIGALRRWRLERRGPSFVRMERCVGYRVSDLESFLETRLCPANEREERAHKPEKHAGFRHVAVPAARELARKSPLLGIRQRLTADRAVPTRAAEVTVDSSK